MSRIAKAPVDLPKGVTATVSPESVTIKGAKGTLSVPLTRGVSVVQADQKLEIKYTDPGLSRTQAAGHRRAGEPSHISCAPTFARTAVNGVTQVPVPTVTLLMTAARMPILQPRSRRMGPT